MTPAEVKTYLKSATIPPRLEPFKSSLLWYGIYANCTDFLFREIGTGPQAEAKKANALAQLSQLFIKRGIFTDILSKKEVINMALIQFSREAELLYVGREEGWEQGLEQGQELQKGVFKMLKQNIPEQEIMNHYGLSPEKLAAYRSDFEELFL